MKAMQRKPSRKRGLPNLVESNASKDEIQTKDCPSIDCTNPAENELNRQMDLDGGLLDLIVLDEFKHQSQLKRLNLTLIIDHYTRAVVGMEIIKLGVTAP
jgi:hypothetical protein